MATIVLERFYDANALTERRVCQINCLTPNSISIRGERLLPCTQSFLWCDPFLHEPQFNWKNIEDHHKYLVFRGLTRAFQRLPKLWLSVAALFKKQHTHRELLTVQQLIFHLERSNFNEYTFFRLWIVPIPLPILFMFFYLFTVSGRSMRVWRLSLTK